jgi:hypothetical protein
MIDGKKKVGKNRWRWRTPPQSVRRESGNKKVWGKASAASTFYNLASTASTIYTKS